MQSGPLGLICDRPQPPSLSAPLALLERLDTWVRASPVLTEIPDMLAGKSRLCERALWDAARTGVKVHAVGGDRTAVHIGCANTCFR